MTRFYHVYMYKRRSMDAGRGKRNTVGLIAMPCAWLFAMTTAISLDRMSR
jgi:hypothetical protein